jgi:hypothetical protein
MQFVTNDPGNHGDLARSLVPLRLKQLNGWSAIRTFGPAPPETSALPVTLPQPRIMRFHGGKARQWEGILVRRADNMFEEFPDAHDTCMLPPAQSSCHLG